MKPLLNPSTIPDANEYGKRRSYYAKLGISQAQFELLYGPPGNKKSRQIGSQNAASWAKNLPKGN